jgi:four helix bundle protein
MQYQSTRIYRRSLELIDFVKRAVARLPPGFAFLVDQTRRAAASVTLNFVEGCGRVGVADRRRFFAIAIGSAYEVFGALDVLHHFGVLEAADRDVGQDLCHHVAAMLRRYR